MDNKSASHLLSISLLITVFAVVFSAPAASQPYSGRNVNMVSGTQLPEGDPFLQRQNEPSCAVSTRNRAHLLCGSNDYRAVDLAGLPGSLETGDAWLSYYISTDGAQTWTSTLMPGYLQDPEMTPPLYGFQAAADPVVRAGAHGMFLYAGIVLNRGENPLGKLFVSRFIDLNNKENASSTEIIDILELDSGVAGQFIDKPWMAVDIPRGGGTCSISVEQDGVMVDQLIPAFNVYVSYSTFVGHAIDNPHTKLFFMRSNDCGETWYKEQKIKMGSVAAQGSNLAIDPISGAVYLTWRQFRHLSPEGTIIEPDAIMMSMSTDFGKSFSKPEVVAELNAFDQPTLPNAMAPDFRAFRFNSYPSAAVDGQGRLYVAWSERGWGPAPYATAAGDARIVVATYRSGEGWTAAAPIDNHPGFGHQFWPTVAFANGKLQIAFMDLRADWAKVFEPSLYYQPQVVDNSLVLLPGCGGACPTIFPRPFFAHTADVRIAMADPIAGGSPAFAASTPISRYRISAQYAESWSAESGEEAFELPEMVYTMEEFNPYNLPIFDSASKPFGGDYIDMAPSPSMIMNDDGDWEFNLDASGPLVSHVFWTDNRDIEMAPGGDWSAYVPPNSDQTGYRMSESLGETPATCIPGGDEFYTGIRNQNVYTARVTDGLYVSAPGNTKPPLYDEFGELQDRGFVIHLTNATREIRAYQLEIMNQPGDAGADRWASFEPVESGDPPLMAIEALIGPKSSISRTVFLKTALEHTASAHVPIEVKVSEIEWQQVLDPNYAPVGYTWEIVRTGTGLNGVEEVVGGLWDAVLLNGDATNPVLIEPDQIVSGQTGESIAVSEIHNPDMFNPDMFNPDMFNPDMYNPDMFNPDMFNPDMFNPDMFNPDMFNPDMYNPDMYNPDMFNPDMFNPDMFNAPPESVHASTWSAVNVGNTTSAYSVRPMLSQLAPTDVGFQLIMYKIYRTPAAAYVAGALTCDLDVDGPQQEHHELVANLTYTNPDMFNPDMFNAPPTTTYTASSSSSTGELFGPALYNDPSLANGTVFLAPGEEVRIILRAVDANPGVGEEFDPETIMEPVFVPEKANTGEPAPVPALVITTGLLPSGVNGLAYSTTLTATGGIPISPTDPYQWSYSTPLVGDDWPTGLTLDATSGEISALAGDLSAGSYSFEVQAQDGSSPPQIATRRYDLTISFSVVQTIFFAVQPSLVAAGQIMAPAVVVGTNPPIPGTTVTLSLLEGTSGASLAGGTANTSVDGIAQFNLAVDTPGTGYALSASISGLEETASSNKFIVTNLNSKTVFVTSGQYWPDFGGLTGGDAICQGLAENVYLPGTYRAWLSDSVFDAEPRMNASADPYRLVDGTLIAGSFADLIDCPLPHSSCGDPLTNPIDRDEFGDQITSGFFVWTGTFANGLRDPDTAYNFCADWTSRDAGDTGRVGDVIAINSGWTSDGLANCNMGARLYCIEQ